MRTPLFVICVLAVFLPAGAAISDTPDGETVASPTRGPLLPNFAFVDRPGWDDHLVPRPTDDATTSWVPVPAVLYGDSAATWINTTVQNASSVAADPTRLYVYRDGTLIHHNNYLFGFVPGTWFGPVNGGPYAVSGGRHTLRVTVDPLDAVEEFDEEDNDYAVQYVWRPAPLEIFTTATRPAPPYWAADTDYLPGSFFDNCDGVRILPEENIPVPDYEWRVVWAQRLVDSGLSYYLNLFDSSDDPTKAFTMPLANTAWNGGLEALIVNTRTFGAGPWDVGIYNYSGNPEDYEIQTASEGFWGLAYGSEWSTSPSMGRLALAEFHIESGQLGPATLTLYADPESGPVHFGWLGPDHTVGNLTDLQGATVTDAEGCTKINVEFTQIGNYTAVFYRNQGEHPSTLVATPGLFGPRPDLEPVTSSGWYAPFVPRPAPDASPTTCALPDTLHGNAAGTWFNLNCLNSGTVATDTVSFALDIDGHTRMGIRNTWTSLAPGQVRTLTNVEYIGEPWTVPGGRHTLSYELDYFDDVAESVERNNWTGRQYCWSPLVVPDNTAVWRDYLPDREGGFDACDGPDPVAWNCDGLRLEPAVDGFDGYWRVLAVMPRNGSADIDLELHEPLTGTLDGFGPQPLAASVWSAGDIEFVVVNDHDAPQTPYDYGVLDGPVNYNGGYTAEAVSSWRGAKEPSGPQDSARMAAGRMIHLHEFAMAAGTQLITIEDLGGGIDWGLSIYGDGAFHGKGEVLDGGLSWGRPAGATETVLVTVPANGYYCVAVWKASAGELDKAGNYRLLFAPGVTGVEDEPADLPPASRLMAAVPNPFNPQTTIAFEVAIAGPGRVTMHDLQGRLVRTLLVGHLAPGRHEAVWDGLDAQGRRAASGVYVARLAAADRTDLLKVTLVK